MWSVDYVSAYLYGLKSVALVLAAIILISSLDDLFIDLVYWGRRLWRRATVYRRHARTDGRKSYDGIRQGTGSRLSGSHQRRQNRGRIRRRALAPDDEGAYCPATAGRAFRSALDTTVP